MTTLFDSGQNPFILLMSLIGSTIELSKKPFDPDDMFDASYVLDRRIELVKELLEKPEKHE